MAVAFERADEALLEAGSSPMGSMDEQVEARGHPRMHGRAVKFPGTWPSWVWPALALALLVVVTLIAAY
eukprot:CAMPEP_0206531076 /NCGR_PEP_ID=MMETSP0325_2-20121206/3557_1 /ASSEMBLY_ACC=CAM_ASM_000347 /TAXON_ID=2866 /ORGANISM="Crypthecodinium cohnii, Strain Seligo" /LENGTH=68 /DNA_ID=CAMNT_0054027265 /DNA_START=32 /DNA_END=235 /DNA_ORIENTATION=-